MSGGVDSSVAAALLVEAGYAVVGATMKTFCYGETPHHTKTCCGLDGIQDARRVADRLGIDHYVFDVEEAFTRDVIDDFVHEYAHGRTPNPCVRCNSYTKFNDLFQRGRALECDYIATGHYVQVDHSGTEAVLRRGADTEKDQAYFLWGLPRPVLGKLLFPLGRLDKAAVRAAARERGLTTADKPESQEICFVPSNDYRDLLRQRLGERHPALLPGPIVTEAGVEIGEHRGFAGFTVGQRKGLGGGFVEPMYVLEVRPQSSTVVVGPRSSLEHTTVRIEGLHWLTGEPPAQRNPVGVQIRHRAPEKRGHIRWADAEATVELDQPARAVTPGQSAALFVEDRLIGGGRIAAP